MRSPPAERGRPALPPEVAAAGSEVALFGRSGLADAISVMASSGRASGTRWKKRSAGGEKIEEIRKRRWGED